MLRKLDIRRECEIGRGMSLCAASSALGFPCVSGQRKGCAARGVQGQRVVPCTVTLLGSGRVRRPEGPGMGWVGLRAAPGGGPPAPGGEDGDGDGVGGGAVMSLDERIARMKMEREAAAERAARGEAAAGDEGGEASSRDAADGRAGGDQGSGNFVGDLAEELGRVTWPSLGTVVQTTGLVVGIMVASAVVLLGANAAMFKAEEAFLDASRRHWDAEGGPLRKRKEQEKVEEIQRVDKERREIMEKVFGDEGLKSSYEDLD